MSEAEHTAEPWDQTNLPGPGVEARIGRRTKAGKIELVAYVPNYDGRARQRANVYRIINCVNAMHGIPDPAGFVKNALMLADAATQ